MYVGMYSRICGGHKNMVAYFDNWQQIGTCYGILSNVHVKDA